MKKNIMFLIGQMQTGGAEKVIYNLCNNLKDKYNVTLVVRTMKNADYIPNVKIYEIPELSTKKTMIGILKLRRLKRKLKIDTTISFLLKYNAYNYLSKYHDKVIISVRNCITDSKINYPRLRVFLFKLILKKVNLIVNVSESVKWDLIENFNAPENKCIVIPNFCELDSIKKNKKEPLPLEHQKIFNNKVIISSGRYSYQKGTWHLIRAFQKVVFYDKEAHLVLTGRGPLKGYYQNLVKELKLENNIYILDYVDNIYRYLYQSKIYVLTSFYEGMPNALLEAMACGLPVIATDTKGGSKEIIAPNKDIHSYTKKIIEEKYGILIPVCDRNMYDDNIALTKEEIMIADAIIMLLKDNKRYQKYKKASEDRIIDYEKEKILKMWMDIL